MAASSAGLGVFAAEDGADKIVNIGVTDSLGGVNPLMMDQTEINTVCGGPADSFRSWSWIRS